MIGKNTIIKAKMGRTVKAKFSHGVIEPLEKVKVPEGREITVTIIDIPLGPKNDAFKQSAGGWKGSINAEELIKNIYQDRLPVTPVSP